MRTMIGLGIGIALSGVCVAASLQPRLAPEAAGACTALADADGFDFGVAASRQSLFLMRITSATNYTQSVTVQATDAKSCTVEPTADGVRATYRAFPKAVKEVVCTVVRAADRLRWRLTVTLEPGWALEETQYPRFLLKTALGADAATSAIVTGDAKGSVIRNPGATPVGQTVYAGRQPGNLAVQFLTYYDPAHLFYLATEDGQGRSKMLAVERRKDGLLFTARHYGWHAPARTLEYDVVMASQKGTLASPCSWEDAADLYKTWAERQRWCKARLTDRTDLPAWLKDAPAMVRFYEKDFQDAAIIPNWMHGFWTKEFPGTPLIVAMWGWEHGGTWIGDYFPCMPSDDAFRAITADLRVQNAHAFPWPSGYHWTLTYNAHPDGTYDYDSRPRFEREAAPHAVWNRDGKRYDRAASWLKGGTTACMCGGDEWARNWFSREVCLGLASRGCEVVQADQIVGGTFPACWAKNHPHAPGEGDWKVASFRAQLAEARAAMAEAVPVPVLGFEEPCELYNDLIGIQDYRDCNPTAPWAGVFNYLYHEYVPCFQSCLYSRAKPQWMAHLAVDGQIPLFGAPGLGDPLKDVLAMPNGDFETISSRGDYFPNWETHAGKHAVDSETKHSGLHALRFETADVTNRYEISRSLALEPESFVAGRTYRLSAWLKTAVKTKGAYIAYGVYTPGYKASRRRGNFAFPKPEEGWVRVESSFVMPDEKDLTLRVMIHCGAGANRVWIDDMTLEEMQPDGTAREVRVSTRGWYFRFMKAWVEAYHGEGREWLAHGRHIRPPRVTCAQVGVGEYDRRKGSVTCMRPAVHCGAYVSRAGVRALVFANATRDPQPVTYAWPDGSGASFTLAPCEIRIVK